MKSFVKNSYIIGHRVPGGYGPMFYENAAGEICATLDGFMIVPRELIPDEKAFLGSLIREPWTEEDRAAARIGYES